MKRHRGNGVSFVTKITKAFVDCELNSYYNFNIKGFARKQSYTTKNFRLNSFEFNFFIFGV